MTTRKRKTESLFEAMADKSKKPDAPVISRSIRAS
jgi:hypothetical protein